MSAINKKIISRSIRDSLRSEELALVLGKTTKTPDRSIDNQEEMMSASSAAFKIDPRNIREAIRVPRGVSPAVFKMGSTKMVGTYTSQTLGNPDENSWPLFYGTGQHGNILFLILGKTMNNRRELETGPIVINEKLTDVSGNIATTQDGNIMYCAVQKVPDDWVTNYKTHYIPYFDVNSSLKEKEQYHTSNKSKATAICGAGNEQRCGTCCLYHSTGVYDSVAGVTFSSGDLYKCVESKCYQCIELANSLGMRYVFNKWLTGGTGTTGGTGGRCLSCDSTNFPQDCGPCPCSIDWNETSYYEKILNDTNVSSELSQWKNAHYEKNGKLKYGNGSVSRVSIDLSGYTKDQRRTSSVWKNREKFVPFVADVASDGTEPVIQILTYKDGNGDEYIDGIAHPLNHGNGLGDMRINEDIWLDMFPNIPISNLRIDVIPNGGFTSNLNSIFDTGSLLSMTISKDDILNTGSIQNNFNVVSVQILKDINNNNALSGLGPSQKYNFNMGVVLTVHKKLYSSVSFNDLPAAGSNMNSTSKPHAKGTHNTTTKQVKVLSSQKSSDTQVKMEISTSNPNTIVAGDEFSHGNTNWVVDDVSSSVSYGGDNIDKSKSDILHLDKTNIDISTGNDPNYPSSFSFDIFWGI